MPTGRFHHLGLILIFAVGAMAQTLGVFAGDTAPMPYHGTVVSPTSLDFGFVEVDSGPTPSQSLTLTYSGFSVATTDVQLSGEQAAEFMITAGGGSGMLASGEMSVVSVAFDPSALGSRRAELVITSDQPVSPEMEVPLTGVAAEFGPTGLATGQIVQAILGIIPASPEESFDLNGDDMLDAADAVSNSNAVSGN
ncbi:choice-of-anchor D domain-containing protein [Candidatus Sumerlaeota bacterium]|nr:choice-of-anchor D domain-containing protein [Candidatus Sumerlaeota bacterium]